MTVSKVSSIDDYQTQLDSPFHRGEQWIQSKLGVREQMERFGKRVIRDHMPDQHRAFYQQLPFVLAGHQDLQGDVWASMVFGEPGFIEASSSKSLALSSLPVEGDPLRHSLMQSANKPLAVGLLGIELPTRRRNRLSAHLHQQDTNGWQLEVDQTFGNCPQYIQSRELLWLPENSRNAPEVSSISELDVAARELISRADTFFVASATAGINDRPNSAELQPQHQAAQGADVSHRGGQPGFVHVADDGTLTIPDFSGNNHFNTFGNLIENPSAGLLFVDFERGDLLMLTGDTEIIWNTDDPKLPLQAKHFSHADRFWQFKTKRGIWLRSVLPFRWGKPIASPNSQLTGSWSQATASLNASQQANKWHSFTIAKVIEESPQIRSLYLMPPEGIQPTFLPGQHITVKQVIDELPVIRTYTVSSAPEDPLIRISVKREIRDDGLPGQMSAALHQLQSGAVLSVKLPRGQFYLDYQDSRPAVLLSAGIGITPILSMARHWFNQGFRNRQMRPLTVICSVRNLRQRAFYQELMTLAEHSGGMIRVFWVLSQPEAEAQLGFDAKSDFQYQGHIDKAFLEAVLPLDDYRFYLCGPTGYMQTTYELLLELGVADDSIKAEAFGPSSIKRQVAATSSAGDTGNHLSQPEQAELAREAIVEFTGTGVEQAWTPEQGTLLEFAEAHGLTPAFSCRNGQCGACRAQLVGGEVIYETQPGAAHENNEVLLCCAKPAAAESPDEMPTLAIELL
ncbi:pyridoxamine 5'-phosphate oxidase family protein [Corallincola platygyrae]|uniref:Pyridoxamine 5'-phosphate oxidase family protein n=1 Tax=Corallincola platygyrae TaxID=1193278 RepID=A0ABW4XLT9_9GAMM